MDCEDVEERKAKRANRIQKREEAIKKNQEALEDLEQKWDLEKIVDEDISPVEQQVAESAALLEHLLADTEERVSNVLVASDAREVNRRIKEEEKRNQIVKKLEDEANLAKEKFETISSTWDPILSLHDPLNIRDEINAQKERCANLVQQKDSIIKDLKSELHQADEMYYKDLKKQMNDIKQLGERIDSQVMLMKEAYQSELAMIENSIQIERTLILKENEKKWNNLYIERDISEANNLETKITETMNFEHKMDELTALYRERYSEAKLKLETDIQTLQIELQKIKQTCLINSEKIDYNYQILKKRDKENVLIRSQQKLKMNNMQDIIIDLKKKIGIRKKEYELDEAIFSKEIMKINNAIMELENKAESMKNINDKKYKDVWQMNEAKAFDLFEQIVNIDKHICENILGIEWTNISHKSNNDSVHFYKGINKDYKITQSDSKTGRNKQLDTFDNSLVRHVMTIIANSTEFLIEKSLAPVLEKYEETSQALCKIDNIFNALNITSDSDVQILCEYFIKYAICTECNKTGQEIWTVEKATTSIQSTIKIDEHEIQVDSSKKSATKCPKNHSLKLFPSKIHQALKEFAENHTEQNETDISAEKSSQKSENVILPMDVKGIQNSWKKFKSPLAPGTEKMWDLLLDGLNKYFTILQERIKLYEEVVELRKENKELQILLRGNTPEFQIQD